ncbi:MAG: hypothetical protein ACKO7Q_03545 [Actinomycetota bacterium]
MSVSDYVRSALRRAVEEGPRPTTLELLGDAVGKFDSAAPTPPTQADELGDYLLDEHVRATKLRRARRHPRPRT